MRSRYTSRSALYRLTCAAVLLLAGAACSGDPATSPSSSDAGAPDAASADAGAHEDTDGDADVHPGVDAISDVADARVDTATDVGSGEDTGAAEDTEGDADAGDVTDIGDTDATPVTLVVSGPSEAIGVGDTFPIRCRAELPDGAPASGVPARLTTTTPELAQRTDSGVWQAIAVGVAEFECADARGLLPSESLRVSIEPGLPSRLEAQPRVEVATAGVPFAVDCIGYDLFGAALGEIEANVVVRTAETDELVTVATAGLVDIALESAVPHVVQCAAPTATDTPETVIEVVPANPAGVRISPEDITVTAGDWQTFDCVGADTFGNETGPVEGAVLTFVEPEPRRPEPEVDGRDFRAFRTSLLGDYTLRCGSGELPAINNATVALVPSHVERIAGSVNYNGTTLDFVLPIVPPGSFIQPAYVASDRWRNIIAYYPDGEGWLYSLTPEARPSAGGFGWVVDEPGAYEIYLGWENEGGEVVVEAREPFYVDAGGPRLRCESPAHAEWTELVPGETAAIRVEATDTQPVEQVTIDGVDATLVEGDIWSVERTIEPGVNLLDVRAADALGSESAVACAFMAGYGYGPTDTPIASTAAISIGNAALDDDDREDPLDSLTDLLLATLGGEAFVAGLEGPLTATDPLFADTIDVGLFTVDATVTYEGGFGIDGPNDAGLRVVDGALELPITIRNLGLDVEVTLGFLGSSVGRITAPRIATDATIAFEIVDGVASAVIEDLPPTEVDPLTASFDRPIFDGAFDLAEPDLRADLAAQLDATLETSLGELVASSLVDPEAFSVVSEFEVPPLSEGDETLSARLSAALGSGGGEGDDLVLRLDSIFDVEGSGDRVAPGVPLVTPSDAVPDVEGVGVFVDPTLLNQGFVALWEVGFFDARLFDFGEIFEVAPDATIGEFVIEPALPPTITLRDGRVVLTLGAVYSDVMDVFYGEGVIDAQLGAQVSALPVVDEDGQLAFDDVRVERAIASLQPANFTPDDYARITEGIIDATLDEFVAEIFSSTLPELPTLELPGSEDLAPFGLGPDDVLTITDPTAYATDDWIVLDGPLGIR